MSHKFFPVDVGPTDLAITFSKDMVAVQQRKLEEETLGNDSKKEGLMRFHEEKWEFGISRKI